MLKKLQYKYALSQQGAKDLLKGILGCTLQNISFMFPMGLIYCFIEDILNGCLNINKIYLYAIGCIACLLIIFGATIFQYNSTFLATYIETGVRRITLAEKLRKIPLSFFGKKDLADLTSTIMADCTHLETAFSHFIPPFFGAIISTIIIAIGLLIYNWKIALAALWVLPVAFAIVYFSANIQEKLSKKAMKAKIDCADGIQECIESVQDLKANNSEEKYLTGLDKKIKAVEKRAVKSEFGTATFVVSSNLILKIGIASVALVGTILLSKNEIDVLTFFMFLIVVSRLYDPLQSALQNLAAIISCRTNISRMDEILYHDIQSGSNVLTNKGYDIVFENVGFAYNSKNKILDNISFTAKQGEVTALVGPSGGGKTTVSRLASRFWDINKGKITVGGMDISKIEPETLMSLYSIVFQDVTLFNNTIMENIRIGKKEATDEEVIRAAHLANCDEFINKLPDGYNTMIGENGCQLSGGERQRISIARAFLKDAPIILLDEATSSLDTENETYIQNALSKLIKNKTVLVIAHRMRTIYGADKIIVLKDGNIAEIGNGNELMEKNGIFSNMVKLQKESLDWKL